MILSSNIFFISETKSFKIKIVWENLKFSRENGIILKNSGHFYFNFPIAYDFEILFFEIALKLTLCLFVISVIIKVVMHSLRVCLNHPLYITVAQL